MEKLFSSNSVWQQIANNVTKWYRKIRKWRIPINGINYFDFTNKQNCSMRIQYKIIFTIDSPLRLAWAMSRLMNSKTSLDSPRKTPTMEIRAMSKSRLQNNYFLSRHNQANSSSPPFLFLFLFQPSFFSVFPFFLFIIPLLPLPYFPFFLFLIPLLPLPYSPSSSSRFYPFPS